MPWGCGVWPACKSSSKRLEEPKPKDPFSKTGIGRRMRRDGMRGKKDVREAEKEDVKR
jgi:hypothetical protein